MRTDLGEEAVDNLDGKGWMRTDIPSLTRELAAETRALRMLHLPDTRTPAQKRKVMEARAAAAAAGTGGGNTNVWNSGAGGIDAAAAVVATPAVWPGTVVQELSRLPPGSTLGLGRGTAVEPERARQELVSDVADGPRPREFAEGGPATLSPKCVRRDVFLYYLCMPFPPRLSRFVRIGTGFLLIGF